MHDVAISVCDLVKKFEVYDHPSDLALEILTRRKRHKLFTALDGVSFDVARGEVVGIIGSNGAGKSTLLKIITGVMEATSGTVEIVGKVTAILELGLGFNPEYSGRENIYLSGLLYGMGRAEINSKLNSIISFSGLAEFIERPVKTYSSGMHARLAFSIATAVEPDILIIDEALGAGDVTFVYKCMRRIRQLCSGGRTVLVVSHGTSLLAQLCHRVIWLEQGRVQKEGPAMHIIQAYDLAAHQGTDDESWIEEVDQSLGKAPLAVSHAPETSESVEDRSETFDFAKSMTGKAPLDSVEERSEAFDFAKSMTGKSVFRRGPVLIDHIELLNAENAATNRLIALEDFTIRISYRTTAAIPKETLGVALMINTYPDLIAVLQWNSQNMRPTETQSTYNQARFRPLCARSGKIDLKFSGVGFRPGPYLLSVGLLPNLPGIWEFYEYRHFYYKFEVENLGFQHRRAYFRGA